MNEPVRKNYLDLMKGNLAAADLSQFITRYLYIGTYNGTLEELQKKFKTIIYQLRSEYSDVSTTGLLLVYPQYFVHILETSEEIIYRHLIAVFHDEETKIDLGRVVPLPPYHHVHQRFFSRWLTAFTVAPTLMDKLEGSGSAEVEKQLSNCLSKIYTLCDFIASSANGNAKVTEEILQNLREKAQRYLPESTVLEFLMNVKSPMLKDIREYVDLAELVPFIRLYNENIWPPTCDFMPRDVFSEQSSRRDLILQRMSMQQQSQRQSK